MTKIKLIACIAACLAIFSLFSACETNDVEPEVDAMATPNNDDGESYEQADSEFKMTGRLYFGDDKNKALLMDDSGSLIWIYPKTGGMLDPYNTGDRVEVVHGAVMLSLPGQTNISSISLISKGDESVFTEDELAEIMKVVDGFN